MKTRLVSVFVSALVLVAPLFAAPASPELAAKIDRLFAKWDHRDTPGAIVAIARDGEMIYAHAYGMANLEHAIPLTPETLTESGSVAKQFTAASVVLLAQRGKLSLDDPIGKYLPELQPTLGEKITVRMLLNHTSGLRDIHGLYDLLGRPSYTSFHDNADVLRVVSRQRDLNFVPGSEYLYTNTAYILAAIIVQRVSGQPFATFCEEQVLMPHGMTHARWRTDFAAIIPGRASGYEPVRGGGYRADSPSSNIIGNGGLFFTAGDLLKWNASLDETAGEWGAVVKQMQTRSKLNDGREISYALGLEVGEHGGLKEISHGGSTSGYRTFLARYPDQRLSFALLANTSDFNAGSVARALTRLLIDVPAATPPARISIDAAELAACAGHYHSAQLDDLLTLAVRDGKLLLNGGPELIPVAPGKFSNADGTTKLVFASAPAHGFTMATENAVADYASVPAAKPSAAELTAYAGRYHSEELEVNFTVAAKNDRLAIDQWPDAPFEARPLFKDAFTFTPAWRATFTRDATGAITGCELTNGRCRRVKFARL